MPQSRQAINARHYLKRKAPVATRTRATAVQPAVTKGAASMRRRRAVSGRDKVATLGKDGWQVFKAHWLPNQVKGVCKQLRVVCKSASAGDYELRAGEAKRLAIPIGHFDPSVKTKVVNKTESLQLPGRIVTGNIVCILARPGAQRQSDHVDTRVGTAYSVLHVMTKRYINIGDELIELGAGDVLVMRGGTCHAGAKHDMGRPSMLFHVPIGYMETTTKTCTV